MTELERILIDRLERMEAAHQRQTAALEQRLQQQDQVVDRLGDAARILLLQRQRFAATLDFGLEAEFNLRVDRRDLGVALRDDFFVFHF